MTNKMFKCAVRNFCSLFEWLRRQHYTGSTNSMSLGWGYLVAEQWQKGGVFQSSLKTVFLLFCY